MPAASASSISSSPQHKRTEEFPCHYIPLSASGETIAELIEQKDPNRMVSALKQWLRTTIANLEATLEPKDE